jgi:transcriptional regulator with XRE-family HTH domain
MTQSPNERIRAARERAGLELPEAAHQLGVSFEEYRDLEDFEDEVWMTFSLAELRKLAQILGLTPRLILTGDARAPGETVSFAGFSRAIAESVRIGGGDADAWGERAGWDVEPLLRDPEEIWNLSPDGLRDIADAAGIDWRSVLPD